MKMIILIWFFLEIISLFRLGLCQISHRIWALPVQYAQIWNNESRSWNAQKGNVYDVHMSCTCAYENPQNSSKMHVTYICINVHILFYKMDLTYCSSR
jgi:hypothetical protein